MAVEAMVQLPHGPLLAGPDSANSWDIASSHSTPPNGRRSSSLNEEQAHGENAVTASIVQHHGYVRLNHCGRSVYNGARLSPASWKPSKNITWHDGTRLELLDASDEAERRADVHVPSHNDFVQWRISEGLSTDQSQPGVPTLALSGFALATIAGFPLTDGDGSSSIRSDRDGLSPSTAIAELRADTSTIIMMTAGCEATATASTCAPSSSDSSHQPALLSGLQARHSAPTGATAPTHHHGTALPAGSPLRHATSPPASSPAFTPSSTYSLVSQTDSDAKSRGSGASARTTAPCSPPVYYTQRHDPSLSPISLPAVHPASSCAQGTANLGRATAPAVTPSLQASGGAALSSVPARGSCASPRLAAGTAGRPLACRKGTHGGAGESGRLLGGEPSSSSDVLDGEAGSGGPQVAGEAPSGVQKLCWVQGRGAQSVTVEMDALERMIDAAAAAITAQAKAAAVTATAVEAAEGAGATVTRGPAVDACAVAGAASSPTSASHGAAGDGAESAATAIKPAITVDSCTPPSEGRRQVGVEG